MVSARKNCRGGGKGMEEKRSFQMVVKGESKEQEEAHRRAFTTALRLGHMEAEERGRDRKRERKREKESEDSHLLQNLLKRKYVFPMCVCVYVCVGGTIFCAKTSETFFYADFEVSAFFLFRFPAAFFFSSPRAESACGTKPLKLGKVCLGDLWKRRKRERIIGEKLEQAVVERKFLSARIGF